MSVSILNHELRFPPVSKARADGLLAFGGDLSVDRLLLAYRQGIFPWFEYDPICWYFTNPRFVLFPEDLMISKSTKSLLKKNTFRFSTNEAFAEVIHHCKTINRSGQSGTWINDDLQKAFLQLHTLGHAHSAELWQDDELVGGLYGIRLGQVFFGESMFSKKSNASRVAFIKYVEHLQKENVRLIDCQVYTPYLESFGAVHIAGEDFSLLLNRLIP